MHYFDPGVVITFYDWLHPAMIQTKLYLLDHEIMVVLYKVASLLYIVSLHIFIIETIKPPFGHRVFCNI